MTVCRERNNYWDLGTLQRPYKVRTRRQHRSETCNDPTGWGRQSMFARRYRRKLTGYLDRIIQSVQ
jgi:hypothetical protein